jgi:3-deoxy-D-manno-octulosonic-acid transferase
MRLLYILASYVLFFILSPVLCLHPKTRRGIFQRLGFYREGSIPEGGAPRIWLHGASAGDLLALSPMMGLLRDRFPGCVLFCTTITNTGYLMANERLHGKIDGVAYAPYDLWGATRRAVRALRPDILVLEYTEVWPNLIRAAKQSGARIVITNGRFAPQHQRSYRTLFSLIGNPLRDLDLFLMREDGEAERAMGLGAPLERVWVTGNTKFDVLATAAKAQPEEGLRAALGIDGAVRVLIAGSTHEGEEELLLKVYKRLLSEHPDLRLVLAPRYIDRAARVVSLAHAEGLTVRRRSEAGAGQKVVVLDTIGELAQAYGLATLVFVGGSFTKRGGQNIIEPAAQGKPVLFGPHMENFYDSVQVLIGRGGIQVSDPEQLYKRLSELLSRPEAILSLGELARAAVSHVSGASLRNVELMGGLFPNWSGPQGGAPGPSAGTQ